MHLEEHIDAQTSVAVLARHGRSFHLASRLLRPSVRDDAALLYHFCRTVDDIADEGEGPPEQIDRDLDRLEAELRGEAPPRPLVAEFKAMAERRGLDLGAAHELVTGCRTDLRPVRVADDGELLRYCYRVAGTVGLMMCAVLDVTEPDALAHAVDLGVAMQLTNISRDVAEDARMGRVYLPATRLEAHGGSHAGVLGLGDREAVKAVTAELLELADHYYASGRSGMPWIPFRSRAAINVASAVYRQIGVRLLRHGGDPLLGRTIVPLTEKLAAGTRALLGLFSLRKAPHQAGLHTHLAGLPGCRGPR